MGGPAYSGRSRLRKRGRCVRILIELEERPIHRAPLAVLDHLYYYTVQYGLSVRQFTGQHWTYWERLPERLRKAQDNPAELEEVIVELESLAASSDTRRQRRKAQIDGRWAQKETVLNAQLLSVLAALPPDLLALGFREAIPARPFPGRLRIVDLRMEGDGGEHVDFVEPDLLLLGEDHLVMVEIKTRGSSRSSRDYPPNQLLNYLHLVAKCRESGDPTLPDRFTHLILVPSLDPKWLEKQSQWVLETQDEEGRLRVDPEACIELSKKKASYDYEVLGQLAREVPIYYRSWGQLHRAFEAAVEGFGDPRNEAHWRSVMAEIGELARRAGRHK